MSLRVATFNAGLAVGLLPHVTDRLTPVIEALGSLDVDLLFVQEFWLDEHWDALRRALGAQFPHGMRPSPAQAAPKGCCSEEQVRPLVACAEKHCANLKGEQLARCVVEHCVSTALSLPAPCLNCIASHPVGDIHEIVGPCIGHSPGERAEGSSGRYGGLIAYGGSFGTGLLARRPLSDLDSLVYKSSVNARGAMYGRLRQADGSTLPVFATHFSPGGAEQAPQAEKLVEWIEQKVGAEPAILLGDLNATPGSSILRKLERAGFRDASPPDRRGTYVPEGLGTGHISESGWRLDHVLLRGPDLKLRTERILDQVVSLEAEGQSIRTTLSDHVGVLGVIEGA